MSLFDVGVRERIIEIRLEASHVPPEGWSERVRLLAIADDLEWGLNCYYEIRARTLAVANQHRDEKQNELDALRRKRASKEPLTFEDYDRLQYANLNKVIDDPARMLEGSRFGDDNLQARIDDWIRRLQVEGLITPGDLRAINPIIPPSPGRLAEVKKDRDELLRLQKVRDDILLKIPAGWPRREALVKYNELDGPLTESKISDWVEKCRNAKLLDNEWLPMRALGSLWRKILHENTEVTNGRSFFG